MEDLKLELKALGATEVFTYDELADRSFKQIWASIKGVSVYVVPVFDRIPSPSSIGKPCQTRPELHRRQANKHNDYPPGVSRGFHRYQNHLVT